MRKPCGCRGRCSCGKSKDVVYPVKEEVKHTKSEEKVRHVHPSHTRVINHHTVKNEHYYPHSTSYENRVNEVDVRGVSEGPNGDVRGARDYGKRGCCDDDVRGVRDYGRKEYCDDDVAGDRYYGGKGCGCKHHCCCGGRRRRSWI